jgi:methylenetetrahydrofolate--tRNA-(uracil-5-)-methyltransferase
MNEANVVGAGLAGCEAAWQLAKQGIPVRLIEMKPERFSPAHKKADFAELVCSNSLKAEHLTNASGLLKAEMEKFGSLILDAARASRVPAGTALAVDRDRFSRLVTEAVESQPLIRVERSTADRLPDEPAVVATGPLTGPGLLEALTALPGLTALHFFDAAAPIVTAESLDMGVLFRQSRNGAGDDYLNSPLDRTQYDAFHEALRTAELAPLHDFEKDLVFEGCLAVEILASRGHDTLAFGPMRPVGLTDPRTGKTPYAVVQLRQENEAGTLFNLVGFQTRLKWGEQKRVFAMIPGLENAEFARYGVMHRNTYLNSPDILGRNFALRDHPLTRFAGQLTGVEGYVESAASGLIAGLNLGRAMRGLPEIDFGGETLLGALEKHVRTRAGNFQPMNANFGILTPLDERVRGKRNRYEAYARRSLSTIDRLTEDIR